MKIAFVRPPAQRNRYIQNVPLNYIHLAAYLRQEGHQPHILDKVFDHVDHDHVDGLLKRERIDIVGIGCMTCEYPDAVEEARRLKQLLDTLERGEAPGMIPGLWQRVGGTVMPAGTAPVPFAPDLPRPSYDLLNLEDLLQARFALALSEIAACGALTSVRTATRSTARSSEEFRQKRFSIRWSGYTEISACAS